MTISTAERTFFVELGARFAARLKAGNTTQARLTQNLANSAQTLPPRAKQQVVMQMLDGLLAAEVH